MKQYSELTAVIDTPEPQIIEVIADQNQGKSNFIHALVADLQKEYDMDIVTYAVDAEIEGARQISSIAELERCQNSLIIIDEFYTLFGLNTNKRNFELIDKAMSTVYHPERNNVWVLIGLPHHFNKQISSRATKMVFKQTTLADLVNGSQAKRVVTEYKRPELGASALLVGKDEAMMYDCKTGEYTWMKVPHMTEKDVKLSNAPIFRKKVCKKVQEKVHRKSQKGNTKRNKKDTK